MKNGWPSKALGEVCQIKPPKSEARERISADALVSFLPMENLGIDQKFVRASQARPLSAVAGSYTYFANSDILLAKITPCFENGKLGIAEGLINGIGFGSSEYIVFRPERTLNKEWLYYYLSRETFRVEGAARMSGAVGHKRVAKEFIESYLIPVPPLPEQQRIVGILDEAFDGVATAKANAEKNFRDARALFESYLQSVFTQRGDGWAEKPLGSLASFRNGINYTKDSKGESIKIVGVRNFQKNFSAPLDDIDTVRIDGKLSELDSLRQNDILAVRSNGNIELIGRCILVGKVPEKISHSGFTIRIRLSNGEVLPKYLCHFMKSASSRKRLTDGGTGTNIKSLNQGMLSALTIPFPSISMQKVLVEKLESLSQETQRLGSLYKRKLSALEALKKSLLHQAFTGAL
jgi:type I restriction enzyme S subunit